MRRFLWEFLAQLGNLRALEPIIGQSYPTLRKTFDRLLTALGLDATPSVASPADAIMDDLRAGRITPDEATRKLKALA